MILNRAPDGFADDVEDAAELHSHKENFTGDQYDSMSCDHGSKHRRVLPIALRSKVSNEVS